MTSLFYTKGFRLGCFLLLLAGAFMQLLFALQKQNIFRETKGGGNFLLQSSDPQLLTLSSKKKQLLEGDMAGAKSQLQRALTSNAFYVPAWLALAELNNNLGRKEQADTILDYVNTLIRDLKRWRWEKTLVEYQLGRLAALPAELRYIIYEIPGKSRSDALQLAFSLWDDPQQLLDNIGIENLLPLLENAVGTNMPGKALFFWHKIEEEKAPWEQKQLESFLEMLLRNGKINEAGDIWRKYINPESLVYNGDFSKPCMQQAFGWHCGTNQAFEKRIEKTGGNIQGRSLHYRFKGWDNLIFQSLYQVVPLAGAKQYRFTAEFKTDKLTTDQRPFFQIYGYQCKMQDTWTEMGKMVDPNQDWKLYQIDFQVPKDCAAVVISLVRQESLQIDNKLSGQLWLKNIIISDMSKEPISPESQPQ